MSDLGTDLINKVLDLHEKGTPPAAIKKFLSEETGLKKTATRDLYIKISKKLGIYPMDKSQKSSLDVDNKFFYNKKNKRYVFFCKSIGKNIVLPKSEVDYIIKSYSNFYGDESSLAELSLKFNIPKKAISEILSHLNCSHDSLPVSDIDILDKDSDKLVEEVLQDKKFYLFQKLQKRDWENTIKDAEKWNAFCFGKLDPFKQFLDTWTPPKYNVYKPIKEKTGGETLIISLSDLHFGAKAKAGMLFRGKEQNTEYIISILKEYYKRIINDWKKYNWNINHLIILSLGDILHSNGLIPQTTKGVSLHSDLVNEEMFDAAFNILVEFIDNLSRLSPHTTVYSVPGNHWGVGDSLLFKTISVYFRQQKNMSFNISNKFVTYFREKNSLILLTHGANNFYKSLIPKVGMNLQAYVQSMIIHSQEEMRGVNSRILFSADRHHFNAAEFNDFEFYQCSSPVRGDYYSDALNLHSRPRQQGFLLNNDGVKNIVNYFF